MVSSHFRSVGIALLLLFALWLLAWPAHAANYPCSGSKGGVAHCSGELFVCNDGSISGSKKVCTGPRGGQYRVSDGGTNSSVRR